jgi:hypothetical protein
MRDYSRATTVGDGSFDLTNESFNRALSVVSFRQALIECSSRQEMERFIRARDALPDHLRGFIVMYSVDEYMSEGARLFVTGDGLGGFALINGELASLFSLPGAHYGDLLVGHAVQQGAYKLSCFDTRGKLPALYGRHGFEEKLRAAWDDTLAPPNWRYDWWGRPDYVEMRR